MSPILSARQLAKHSSSWFMQTFLRAIATEAWLNGELRYRAESLKGEPTEKILIAVLWAIGLRLSVEPEKPARA